MQADDGALEVEAEVDTNRAGQTWRTTVRDGGSVVFRGDRVTKAPSGSFEVERRTADRAGTDVVTLRATRGDRVCAGTVRF
ncbi:hypothetical protein GCM10025868_32080 [Angustibacter aerolatus]|uniref:Uncharacterized protein n=1 Tax=Angustibacter aerolatus TaxID=1162965 RepID=A0ABQ6JID7_9ACTN|nr:hypothetical protein [Angustibacter aerolatus]GMA87958.1 hypothetical protein GCM10025868_32080 [Angustibacter aerolatus]